MNEKVGVAVLLVILLELRQVLFLQSKLDVLVDMLGHVCNQLCFVSTDWHSCELLTLKLMNSCDILS